ncbi:MAG: OmpA family protein [Polaribacter sp.]|uniref:OmpA family protein n=1 Tax=Polaribacter sp. TaxID=1920175 RepID=UPI002F35957A
MYSQITVVNAGETIYSPNKTYSLTMQNDTNLCVYKNKTEFKWCTMSNGYGPNGKALIKDGKFIIKNSSGNTIWHLTGVTTATTLKLTDEGVLQVLDKKNKSLWDNEYTFSTAFDYESDYVVTKITDVFGGSYSGSKGDIFNLSPMRDDSFYMSSLEEEGNESYGFNAKSNPRNNKFEYNIENKEIPDSNGAFFKGKTFLLMNGDIRLKMEMYKDSLTLISCEIYLKRKYYDDETVDEETIETTDVVVVVSDIDGDGVKDSEDKCPNIPGEISNKGCPKFTGKAQITLNEYAKTIEFDFGRSSIKTRSDPILRSIISFLNEYPNKKFEIQGHTDSKGTETTNLRISESRAESVSDYLISHGIHPSRISFKGYGKSKPIDSNKTRNGRANNNRVEINAIN